MLVRKGFTLIELLIVIAIIAILALIAIPNFLEAQTRSKVARAQADMRSMATAIEAYITDFQVPPAVYHGGPGLIQPAPNNNRFYCFRWRYCPMLLRPLTSPVAYITSYPPDVFQEKNLDQQWDSNADGTDDTVVFSSADFLFFGKIRSLTYSYEMSPTALSAYGTSPFGLGDYVKNKDLHSFNWSLANGESDWMLISAGPDRDYWSGYRAEYNDPIFNVGGVNPYNPPAMTLPSGVPAPTQGCRLLVPWPLGCYDPSNGSISWGAIRRTGSSQHSN